MSLHFLGAHFTHASKLTCHLPGSLGHWLSTANGHHCKVNRNSKAIQRGITNSIIIYVLLVLAGASFYESEEPAKRATFYIFNAVPGLHKLSFIILLLLLYLARIQSFHVRVCGCVVLQYLLCFGFYRVWSMITTINIMAQAH